MVKTLVEFQNKFLVALRGPPKDFVAADEKLDEKVDIDKVEVNADETVSVQMATNANVISLDPVIYIHLIFICLSSFCLCVCVSVCVPNNTCANKFGLIVWEFSLVVRKKKISGRANFYI